MYSKCAKIKTSDLKKGDLVFFDFEGKGVSHVGIYLSNNEYAHASTSKGVVISNLDNAYMQKRYVGAGRFLR
jgi:lipoprotein Spr